jgi:hypothetical protein
MNLHLLQNIRAHYMAGRYSKAEYRAILEALYQEYRA